MSTIDPAKLKVVELRAELSSRGLDAKGNKPVLVKRLKEALEKELQKEIPDTSIADTSTEEHNTSQESVGEDVQSDPLDKGGEPYVSVQEGKAQPSQIEVEKPEDQQQLKVVDGDTSSNEFTIQSDIQEVEIKNEIVKPVNESAVQSDNGRIEVKDEVPKETDEGEPMVAVEENGDNVDHEMQEVVKSDKIEDSKPIENDSESKVTMEEQSKGEKRRRSSQSPERVQRRRSKTPIREDEPILDNNKIQLSWYDSDLHLLVDKKTFLSGKPYHEGAFGYAWAGARATHGVKSGKVCFEVKITEELKWDDLVRQSEKKKDCHKSDNSKRERQKSERDSSKSSRDGSKIDDCNKADVSEDSLVDGNKGQSENDEKEKSDKVIKDGKELENNEKSTEEPDSAENSKQSTKTKDAKEESEEPCVNESQEKQEAKKEEKQDAKEEEKQEPMEIDEISVEPIARHLLRVGWSVIDSGLQLGEAKYSYGYESSGKFVINKEFADYGVRFGIGDVIGAYLSIGDDRVIFTYTVNGELQPEAVNMSRADLPQEDFALFPHILTRNYAFELNMGGREEPWFPHPCEFSDYKYIDMADNKVQGPLRPESRSECEVVMMCGLPASGKTHWVREMVKENPEKRYTVIGNSHLLDKMTVNGNPLKNSYKGRWNVILDKLMKCINVLVETAALRRRNYVIDQTNVFPSAQRRKMRLFEGFKRRAVVVVVADEEQAKRRAQQEAQDGKDVPDSAILEMKANMSLPRRGEWLEEVSYVELGEEEARALVQKYNQQGREAGFGPIAGQRSGYRHDNRGHPYRWDHSTSRRDYRGGYRDNRSYQSNRYDRPRQHGGWQNRRPPPGSWNRDIRRDSRGPPGGGSRDFRNSNRSSGGSGGGAGGRQLDRSGSRDNRNRSQSGGNFNRNQRSQNNRTQPANWQGGGSGGSWQNPNWSGQGVWNQQGGWSQGGWGGQAQQWKGGYGQGSYGQGSYGNYPNWNYYGQYTQNWNSQGQPQTTTAGGAAASDNTNAAYGQYSQQAAWAQYAQQYAQQGQASTTTQQQSTQK